MTNYLPAREIRFHSNFSSVAVTIKAVTVYVYPQPSSRVHNVYNPEKGSHITYKGYTDHDMIALAIELAAEQAGVRVHHATKKSQSRLHHFMLKSVRGYL